MKMNNCLPVALAFTASLAFYNVQAWSQQEETHRFTQIEALLTAKNWVEADRETIALIRNNPQNIFCLNRRAINPLWVQNSSKYGFTPYSFTEKLTTKTRVGVECTSGYRCRSSSF